MQHLDDAEEMQNSGDWDWGSPRTINEVVRSGYPQIFRFAVSICQSVNPQSQPPNTLAILDSRCLRTAMVHSRCRFNGVVELIARYRKLVVTCLRRLVAG